MQVSICPLPDPRRYGSGEDMKLREEDRTWLKKEIAAQIKPALDDLVDSLKPHGAKRIANWLREWGLVATAITTPLTLLGLLVAVSIFAASGLTKNAEFRTHTEDRLGAIEKDVAAIKSKLDELTPLIHEATIKGMEQAENLNAKQLIAKLPDLKRLAKTAKSENVQIKPETVEEVGTKLIEIGSADAWSTALDFLNYKSFLNASLSMSFTNVPGPVTLFTAYEVTAPPGLPPAKFSVYGAVPKEQAAQFTKIGGQGQGDLNQSSTLGNGIIFVDDGGVVLDDMQLKNVVFRNVFISYQGGPISMQNVYFINCTFDVKQQSNGRALVTAALKPSPAISFSAS
jgi:hypothetical protein